MCKKNNETGVRNLNDPELLDLSELPFFLLKAVILVATKIKIKL